MLTLQNISYIHPNGNLLFSDLHLVVNAHEKIALIGNNGTGKSTLLKIIAGELQATSGQLNFSAEPYYVPQLLGQHDWTIAHALRVDQKLSALEKILKGEAHERDYTTLADDWTIEDRCREALRHWQLKDVNLHERMETLSGGEKTKVFLAGIFIHQPELILLDEPSNHLDTDGRQLLYDFIQSTKSSLIVVSHDRKLLDLLDSVCALSKEGIHMYGGNYAFYKEQKQLDVKALERDIQSKEKALRKAREKEQETSERQQKLDMRGKGKQEKAGIARIMMNTFKNRAENSTSKLKQVHAEKISGISRELHELKSELPGIDKMKFGFDHSALHAGKVLFQATQINVAYQERVLWKDPLNFQIVSGERIALRGRNGSGKTSLIQVLLGVMTPATGDLYRADCKIVYIDQDYSLLDDRLRVYEQAAQFNTTALQEHEIKIRLNRFLFTKEDWDKPCRALSGGERMRLLLCCLVIRSQSPDIIILDEPTNNLDVQNIEILTTAINSFRGTLIVVSHDERFLEELGIVRRIALT